MLRSVDKEAPEVKFYEAGLEILRTGGLIALGLERLSQKSGLSNEHFFRIFKDKTDYLAKLYFYNQANAEDVLEEYLDESGNISRERLEEYLSYISFNYPDILAYIDDAELLAETENRIRKYGGSERKNAMKLLAHYEDLKPQPDIAHFSKTLRFASLVIITRRARGDQDSEIDIGMKYLVSKMFRYI